MWTLISYIAVAYISYLIGFSYCRRYEASRRADEGLRRRERQGGFFLAGRYYTGSKPEIKQDSYAFRGHDSYHFFNINHN